MDINQNLSDLMKEAQKMQQRMQEAQQELSELRVKGKSGGGAVECEIDGQHYVRKLTFQESLTEDPEMLQDLIVAAINDAVHGVEKIQKEKISTLTKGLKIPTEYLKDKDDKE